MAHDNIVTETYHAVFVSTCNAYSHPMRLELALAPFYRGNGSPEGSSPLPKATQQGEVQDGHGHGTAGLPACAYDHSSFCCSEIWLLKTDCYCFKAGISNKNQDSRGTTGAPCVWSLFFYFKEQVPEWLLPRLKAASAPVRWGEA